MSNPTSVKCIITDVEHDDVNEIHHQRDVLLKAIHEMAVKVGALNPEVPVSAPQLLMFLSDTTTHLNKTTIDNATKTIISFDPYKFALKMSDDEDSLHMKRTTWVTEKIRVLNAISAIDRVLNYCENGVDGINIEEAKSTIVIANSKVKLVEDWLKPTW